MIRAGFDAPQRNSYAKALPDEGRVLAGRRISHYDPENLWPYLGQLGTERNRSVLEATANARWISGRRLDDVHETRAVSVYASPGRITDPARMKLRDDWK